MHRFQTWRDALQGATSRRGVDKVMRDYVHALPPDIRRALPGECQLALSEPIDVQEAAVVLVQAELAEVGRGSEQAALHEIAHTFAAAAVRFQGLPDITRPRPEPD
jgi:hypothetical protein